MAVVKHFPYQHRTSGDLTQQRRALNLDSLHPAPAKSMLISPPDVAIDHLFPPYMRQKNADLNVWFKY